MSDLFALEDEITLVDPTFSRRFSRASIPALAEPQPSAELGPGMVGAYYPPARTGGPVVMLLGGSEGGFAGSGRNSA